ncbi:FxsB family cyclophane-forming radical SAM/SPASM peptide maturase [Actinoplanes sp. CA-015351]|uniref:FxsB family cyclophane-forming radical SAM/SPASM peptide maturase n=1 Tax=Actinoplanes sp. CA-015351 TaxID=3239897 RepID=UPI003D99DA9A
MTAALEWPATIDVRATIANGFAPRPLRDFVLKIHQRCNLACDYCYVYTMGDDSWRHRPPMMPPDVWRSAAARIRDHVLTHGLDEVRVILHGGEPLLVGRDHIQALTEDLRGIVPDTCRVRLAVQTNGILLDEAMLDLFRAESIEVGISLDGAAADNDRHRRHADGRGSAASVQRALLMLADDRYRPIFAGILCTIDPANDPVGTYESMLRHRPPLIDFLLPHATWRTPPARPAIGGGAAYGDWLVTVYDRWLNAPRKETRIRIFEEIISLLLGGASRSEHVGLSPVTVAVVESDGAIEQVDSLKSAYPGAGETGLNVAGNSFDEALRHPGVLARQLGVAALCAKCLDCPIHLICGAGHYPHRYRTGSGFLNPSVYCADLTRLITHAQQTVTAYLAGRAVQDGR